ncbi:MAG: DUF1800 domain-containing protein [Pseudomonadota bacterium]
MISTYKSAGSLRTLLAAIAVCGIAGCATQPLSSPAASSAQPSDMRVLQRLTWGASSSAAKQLSVLGAQRYIEQQLQPGATAALPAPIQTQIDGLTISQRPFDELIYALEQQRRDAIGNAEPEQRNAAQRAYQVEATRLAREAATRTILRAIYSPNQLHEQMTWFWMNHFSVFQNKVAIVRAMVGDYEEQAIRPHALGRFRSLLGATARHPAMLRYLDNAFNAANRLNENYARELMELHTLGVGAGYSQHDVQELARILTGVGINLTALTPSVRPERQHDYVRLGAFEFNPNRHDYGDKVFLGKPIAGRGLSELDEALDRLARHPATAHFVSRKLAVYFVADEPPAQLVERMSQTFQKSDGDIAAVLRTMLHSTEFAESLGGKFKDPMHYVISALRLSYDERPIVNTAPVIGWLYRLGQGLYNRETPDGYPLIQAAWASPGQMTTRFELAKAIGSGRINLFDIEASRSIDRPVPQLPQPFLRDKLSADTLSVLEQVTDAAQWNTLFLSSPEFMYR